MKIRDKKATENNREYVYQVLRENIMSLRLPPGSIISETTLANQLSVSRTPIREGMFELREELLVETVPQQSTRVAPIRMDHVREGKLFHSLVEPKIFEQMTGTLDSFLAKKFARNLDKQAVACKTKDIFLFQQLDLSFHQLLYQAARKETVWDSRKTITGHYDRARLLLLDEHPEEMKKIYREHQTIFTYLLVGLTATPENYEKHFSLDKKSLAYVQEKYPSYF